jgi:putative ABC transport system permease protein
MLRESVAWRIYRLCLRLLPGPFRSRWGNDMEAMYHYRMEEAKAGRGSPALEWIRCIADVVIMAIAERAGPGRFPPYGGREQERSPLVLDLRHALRRLTASPMSSVIVIATLALGIGVSTAGFSVVHGIALRALPYEQADRLVVPWPERNHNKCLVRMSEDAIPALESVSGIALWTFTLSGLAEPLEVTGAAVSTRHFDVLGVFPVLGRTFDPSEGGPGEGGVVILSHELWMSAFGGDPGVLGRTLRVSGHGHDQRVVIGVMPKGYRPVFGEPQLWVPLEVDPAIPFEADDSWYVNRRVARLAPGATIAQATRQMRTFALGVRERAPDRISEVQAETSSVRPLASFIVRDIASLLWVVLAAVFLVLLVATANCAILLMVRGEAQGQELAIRVALGAGRRRIRRMLLVECGLLGLAGGGIGTLVAFGLVRLFVEIAPPTFPRLGEVGIDGTVLVFALCATLAATLLGGLAPSLRPSRADATAALAQSHRSSSGRPISRLSTALVGIQVALAACVAFGSGLMVRSFEELLRVDPGLDASGVAALRPNPPQDRYPDAPQTLAFYESVLHRLRSLPDVESAGAIHLLPGTSGTWNFPTFPEGVEYPVGTPATSINFRAVLPGYFETLRIPMIRGIPFQASHERDGEKVVVVNEAFVDRFWPGEDALGKQIRLFEPDAPAFRVVGVVGDVRQHARAEPPRPEMYFTAHQYDDRVTLWLLVRFRSGEPLAHARDLRSAVWSVDGTVPVSRLLEFSAVMRSSTQTVESLSRLLSFFASLTLVLGAVSVYAITSHAAQRRRAEYAVRMALGGSRWDILRSSASECAAPAAIGTAVGLATALGLSGVLRSLIYGVSPTDPVTVGAVALILLGTAIMASLIPAWWVTRIDPVRVLQSE